jgi:ubiquinone/menaquinone biosynthesis C-methylase UbiE
MKLRSQPAGQKWRSGSRKAKPRASRDWVLRLEPLRLVRAPYADCQREVVKQVHDRYLVTQDTIVELGAGLGQLREWLPEARIGRWLHTDPDAAALHEHQARFPAAAIGRCASDRISLPDGSVARVVGLCVFDLLPDLTAALREIRRVLAPGGLVVHLLDMAPALEALFDEFAAKGLLALPNLFSDPSSQSFPEDLLVTELAPFARLLHRLAGMNHPLPHVFGHYFRAFGEKPFDAAGTVRIYDAFSRTAEMRDLLKPMLTSAYAAGQRLGFPPAQGVRVSSARHFSERLARTAGNAGFTIVENTVRAAFTHGARDPDGSRYQSLALGHERRLDVVPAELLCQSARMPHEGETLLEAAMHVFVARRTE